MTTSTAITQSLGHLLPQGYAWPRDPSSVWMRVIGALAANLQEHDDWVIGTVARWQPHQTTRLDEWEQACGLPDRCYGSDTSDEARRAAVLVRLRGVTRLVDDGSPAAPAAIEALCMSVGALCTVVVNHPFRAGMRAGGRLGMNGKAHIHLLRNDSALSNDELLAQLACLLERVVPCRYAIDLSDADVVYAEPGALGWPGVRTNCDISGGWLVIHDARTWDTAGTWSSAGAWTSASGTFGYTHTTVDIGVIRRVVILLAAQAVGSVLSEVRTSVDGAVWSAWSVPSTGLVSARFVQARWTVTGAASSLSGAAISIKY